MKLVLTGSIEIAASEKDLTFKALKRVLKQKGFVGLVKVSLDGGNKGNIEVVGDDLKIWGIASR
jgi:hypothetical protein